MARAKSKAKLKSKPRPKPKPKSKPKPKLKRARARTSAAPARDSRGYVRPELLMSTAELAQRLGDKDLRIVDCNVVMSIRPDGGYDIRKGVDDWRAAHIPGATFIDLVEELAAPHPKLRFMMTPPAQFAAVMSAHGIGNRHRVVLYSRGANYWATRLFLMFRAMGHDQVQVLDGGWDKWLAEGRPVTNTVAKVAKANFKAKPRAGQIIGKAEVAAALGRADICLINALHPDVYSGKKFSASYARAGHIPGSVNVYAMDLIDPKTKTFLPAKDLRAKFAACGALSADRVITYCGGGISATTDSFALMLLGHDNVALYDGSMTEWGPDLSLPIATSA
ncbi:MAG: sulfurtransferase [Rhodospirillaceae bacterium]|nr:sulfurtransferase [Rhodospirillaceae bacterium]